MSETDYWEAKPITQDHQLKTMNDKLESLTSIEFSSRILLGALYRQKKIAPQDYVLQQLQTQFTKLESTNPEF